MFLFKKSSKFKLQVSHNHLMQRSKQELMPIFSDILSLLKGTSYKQILISLLFRSINMNNKNPRIIENNYSKQ